MPYSITIDLHGETTISARQKLQSRLNSLPKNTRELVVIHGYRSGTALQETVRKFKHPKVERVIIGLNQGETTLLIKK